MLQGHETRPAYSPPRMQQWTPRSRGFGDRNSFLSRGTPQNIPGTGFHLGSMWMIEPDPKNYPYILDWYYTSRPHHVTNNRRDVPPGPLDIAEEESREFWVPPHLPHNEATNDENWSHIFEDRSQSHLEASTSAPLFHESVLQHQDSSNMEQHPNKSHWWARSRQNSVDPKTSFLEPPNFAHNTSHNYYDNLSDRSLLEEEEHHLDWRSSRSSQGLSRTFYMNDLEAGGEFNLPFDDIYSRPQDSPNRNFDPASPM